MLAPAMERDYELFEHRPDGVLNWRGTVRGLAAAQLQVKLLALETGHDIHAMDAFDRRVVARAAAAVKTPAAA
jgi:hypothetical protein